MAESTITPGSKEAAEALVPLFEFERMLNQGKLFPYTLLHIHANELLPARPSWTSHIPSRHDQV